MFLTTLAIWACAIVLGSSAVMALVWAIKTGQMADFSGAARSIFDDDEPVGRQTDYFPVAASGKGRAR